MGKGDDYLLHSGMNEFNYINFLIFSKIHGGNKSFHFRCVKTRKDEAFRKPEERKTTSKFQRWKRSRSRIREGVRLRAKNKGKRGRDEV